MNLRNSADRLLLRAVIADMYQGMREAWDNVIKRFGLDANKALVVGNAIWSGRDTAAFEPIGFEAVPMKAVKEAIELTYSYGHDFLDYFNKKERNHALRLRSTPSYKDLPVSIVASLKSKYSGEDGKFPIRDEKKAYDELNVAFKAKDYLELVENRGGGLKPGSPQEVSRGQGFNFKSASEYGFMLKPELRVVLNYIASMEN